MEHVRTALQGLRSLVGNDESCEASEEIVLARELVRWLETQTGDKDAECLAEDLNGLDWPSVPDELT